MDGFAVIVALAGGGLIVAALVWWSRHAGSHARDRLVATGRFGEAARQAMEAGDLEQAFTLYLRADEPANAAAVAARRGDVQQAAELYEQAGDWERAVHFFERAGQASRADELVRRRARGHAGRGGAASPPPAGDVGVDLPPEPPRVRAGSPDHRAIVARRVDADLQLLADPLGDPFSAHRPTSADPLVTVRGGPFDPRGDAQRSVDPLDPLANPFADPLGDGATPSSPRAPMAAAHAVLEFGMVDLDSAPAIAIEPPPVEDEPVEDEPVEVEPVEVEPVEPVEVEKLELLVEQQDRADAEARRREHEMIDLELLHAPAGVPLALDIDLDASPPAPVRGLEPDAVDVELLSDAAVEGARAGSSVAALERFAGGRPCDLGNIEVYYRLGLVHLAAGSFDLAEQAFDAVEEASPAYRDGWKRANQIRLWRRTLAARLIVDGGDGTPERYQVIGERRRGPCSVIYRAHDRVRDTPVELEVLADAFGRRPTVRDRFVETARALMALDHHPGLIAVYDAGLVGGRALVSRELVDGAGFAALLAGERGVTAIDSLRATAAVLAALSHLHARGVVHGAVEPAAIIRAPDGTVRLGGFDLVGPAIEPGPYQAPERAAGRPFDQRADLFGMAAALYHMLTGHPPFGHDRRGQPAPLADVVPPLPSALDGVVTRGLRLDPTERWPSAAAMGEQIQRILADIERIVAGRTARSSSQPHRSSGES